MSEIIGKLPSREEFSGQVDSIFQARVSEASVFDLRLVKYDEHVINEVQENFSLLFLAPLDAPPVQNTFRLEHESLGEMDLFLVPVKKDEDGIYFEAVFNRFLDQ